MKKQTKKSSCETETSLLKNPKHIHVTKSRLSSEKQTTENFSCVVKSTLWEHQSSSKPGFDVKIITYHQNTPSASGTPFSWNHSRNHRNTALRSFQIACLRPEEESTNTWLQLLPALSPQAKATQFSHFSMNFQRRLSSLSGVSKESTPSFWQHLCQKQLDLPGERSLVYADSLLNC